MVPLYRVLTYILFPFAVIFGFFTLITFFIALANPTVFLGVFMLAAFAIYYYCTFRFLHKVVLRNETFTKKLRDWIRVNAYVVLPFGVLNFMQSSTVIRNPSLLSESLEQMKEMQEKMGLPTAPIGSYSSILLSFMYVMIFFSVILLVHLMLSFSFLKKYESFVEPQE